MKTSRILVAVVLIALLGAGICLWTGCSNKKAAATTTLTIGTFSKAIGNTPYYVAKHFKWFESNPALKGVKIIFKEYKDRPSISDALSKGDLQVLFCADVPAILCRAQGNDIRIAALSANVAQNILVRSDLPMRTVPALRGKSIAILQGTSSHYCLLKILKANHMTEKDVDLRYMPAPEAKTAFETNKVDAWAVWAPFVEQQEVSGKGRLITGGDALINSVMSISEPLIVKHKDQAQAVVAEILRAKQWMVANPKEAQQIAATEIGLNSKVVQKAWPKHKWDAQLDDKIVADIQEKADFLVASDKTRSAKKIDVRNDLIDLQLESEKR